MVWIKQNLRRFLTLLSALLRSSSALSAVRKLRPFSTFKAMRRLVTADKVSVRFQYLNDEGQEKGVVCYDLSEGYFVVFTWPSTFSPLRKAQELIRLLSFAVRIIRCEHCEL